MIQVCADKMFPTDQRFYTHITTITMHGQYSHRKNLENLGYYDELKAYGLVPEKVKSDTEINGFILCFQLVLCAVGIKHT